MRQREVDASGIRFGCLEQGQGPLVLLLHGFPDDARTWEAQLAALAAAGYRAVAPFLRGYSPSQPPADGRYDPAALGGDVAALAEALSPDGRAFVVGQDWGGTATHAALALHPERIRAAVLVNTAHPATFGAFVQDAELVHKGFHLWLFQQPFAAAAVAAHDLALVDYLWRLWSPDLDDPSHLARVKETLRAPGVLEAALAYYRALAQSTLDGTVPAARVAVPCLSVFGDGDLTARHAALEREWFTGPYRRQTLQGTGHFPQRECPDALSRLIVEWLAAHS